MTTQETYFKDLEAEWTKTLPGSGYYKILRVDGRNFSKFTKNMDKPFDLDFCKNMDTVAVQLCKEIQGAVFAYVQSDEISVLIWQDGEKSQQWFGGDVAKTLSISAGLASSTMSLLYADRQAWTDGAGIIYPVMFDARVFTVPARHDVVRYFIWRQTDAYRNAVSMAASAVFSHKQLHEKTLWDRLQILKDAGQDFHAMNPAWIYLGRVVTPVQHLETVAYRRKDTKEPHIEEVWRTRWEPSPAVMFSGDATQWLEVMVP